MPITRDNCSFMQINFAPAKSKHEHKSRETTKLGMTDHSGNNAPYEGTVPFKKKKMQ